MIWHQTNQQWLICHRTKPDHLGGKAAYLFCCGGNVRMSGNLEKERNNSVFKFENILLLGSF